MITPKAYRDQDYIDNKLRCKICKNSCFNDTDSADDICGECLVSNGPKDFSIICRSCPEVLKKCSVCNCVVSGSRRVSQYQRFLNVSCSIHTGKQAEFLILDPLLALCGDHQIDRRVAISYSLIEQIFFELFREQEERLCYERKRALITYLTEDLFKACQWLSQVKNGLLCSRHHESQAEYIDPELTLYCSKCVSDKGNKYKLSSNKSLDFLTDLARSNSKNISPYIANKYILSKLDIIRGNPTKPKDVSLLYLEVKDFVNKLENSFARCVLCKKKITVGNRTGVILKCSHVACFSCIGRDFNLQCPIDSQGLQSDQYFENPKFALPECHVFHELCAGDNEVYKLPCYHYSCLHHLNLNHCARCGFRFDKWWRGPKENEMAVFLLNYLDPLCLVHSKSITKMHVFQYKSAAGVSGRLSFACDDCEKKSENIDIKKSYSLVRSFIKLYVKDHLKMLKNNYYNINSKLLKLFENAMLIEHKNYLKLPVILQLINKVTNLENVKSVDMFSENLNILKTFNDTYRIRENTCLAFNITPLKDMVFAGVILNNSVVFGADFEIFNYSRQEFIITVYDKNGNFKEEIFVENSFCQRRDQQSHYQFFNTSLYLCEQLSYDVSFRILPGDYFWSKTYSKIRVPDFELKKYRKNPEDFEVVLNGSMGGILKGLIIENVLDYFKV